MKRILIILTAVAAMLAVNSCEKQGNGTGTLVVEVSDLKYNTDVRIYPYGTIGYSSPLFKETAYAERHQTFTFTLNVGNYMVVCNGEQVVQIQEGKEVTIQFPDDSK